MKDVTKIIEKLNSGKDIRGCEVDVLGEKPLIHVVVAGDTSAVCGVSLTEALNLATAPLDKVNCEECQMLLHAAEFTKVISSVKARLTERADKPSCSDCSCKTTGDRDPNGKSAHEPGAKLDAGKPRMGLVFTGFHRALTEVAKVGTMGAKKYTDHGWMTVPNGIARYEDALLRHFMTDEMYDEESGLMHYAHMAWNALAILELALMEQEG